MSLYVQVPPGRLSAEVYQSLLEEFASRDGTDYGDVELTLEQKTGNLRRQLENGDVVILFETESEQWDLMAAQQAQEMLQD
ncbi:MAG: YheU family protein [Halioglobus sp.]